MSLYNAESYLNLEDVYTLTTTAKDQLPDWIDVREIGRSLENRPIEMIVIGHQSPGIEDRPVLWLDAGTHASEWTSVSAAMYILSKWVELLSSKDMETMRWFERNSVMIVPCISPDGYEAMRSGAPFLRSTTRPPKEGTARSGLEPMDVDGDGEIRWMRWRHPAGPYVQDETLPLAMRPRTLDDDPADAYFVASEGSFIQWDGHKWVSATLKHGLDLNRNFPSFWKPMNMFGMDSGAYPLSSPEARAVMDAFAQTPCIGAALTFHTYTGCILTQPYRANTPLPDADVRLAQVIAKDLVEGTGYDVFKVHPDFEYDPKRPVGGVWAETMSTVFGVPGFTVEFWNPYGHCGVEITKPAEFFLNPEYEKIRPLLETFSQEKYNPKPWTSFEHPQLGMVELGGIDYLKTVRNPPEFLLAQECEVGWSMTKRMMRVLPRVEVQMTSKKLGEDLYEVEVSMENLGFLSTSSLAYAKQINVAPAMSVQWTLPEGVTLTRGVLAENLDHLVGWGNSRIGAHSVYPGLALGAHRGQVRLIVRGQGEVRCILRCGRAGVFHVGVMLS